MFLTKIIIDSYFDTAKAQKFYDLLSTEFSDIELIWKSGTKRVSHAEDANVVLIKVYGKTLYVHNSTNHKGQITFGNADGKEEFVLKSFEKAGFTVAEPHEGNSYIYLGIYALLIVLICFLRPDTLWLILPCVASLIVGSILYVYSLEGFIRSEFGLAKISSILMWIGIIATAPSSLLTMSFIKYINEKNLFKMMEKIKQEQE